MSMSYDILKDIQNHMSDFSKGQRIIGRYIISNYDKASYMTASMLSKCAGVSESTVNRFILEMGFSGYASFQKELEKYVRRQLKQVRKLDFSMDSMEPDDLADFVMQKDIEHIQLARQQLDLYGLLEAADNICNAQRIYIVGNQNCRILAEILEEHLTLFFQNTVLITNMDSETILRKLLHLTPHDVVIGISIPRYSIRTIKALEFASDKNAKIVTLTDQKHSPLCLYSSCNLTALCDMSSIVESYSAMVSLMNVLTVSIFMKKKEFVLQSIENLEQVKQQYSNEETDELNLFDKEHIKDF